MNAVTTNCKQLIEDYFQALSGKPKADEVIRQFVADPRLIEHIHQSETAFPSYELIAHQMVAENDTVAVRATMYGIHNGPFAGIQPTGKHVSGDLMLFYRIADGRIVEHWMQMDLGALVNQLTK